MEFEVDEEGIRESVLRRKDKYEIDEDWFTPSGKERKEPVYETTVYNSFLDKTRDIKGKSAHEVKAKAVEQINKWKEQEIKTRVSNARQEAAANAEAYWSEQADTAKATIESLRGMLVVCLGSSPIVDLEAFYDRSKFPAFAFAPKCPSLPPPALPPAEPKRTALCHFSAFVQRKTQEAFCNRRTTGR